MTAVPKTALGDTAERATPMMSKPEAGRRARVCIGVVSHVLNDAVRAMYERVRLEAPADHAVHMILSTNDRTAPLAGLAEHDVTRITQDEFRRQPYPQKCGQANWVMSGNLDLVFLQFQRRVPDYDYYWFIEYDVHWEGLWHVFFEHFRESRSDLLATTIQLVDDIPHKERQARGTHLVVPAGMKWERSAFLKAFLPICRLSAAAMAELDRAYRAGLGGHYEFIVATVLAQNGLTVEDIGGKGPFVKPDNVNRFYFAYGTSYSHSPGTFVFRPDQRVLPRSNTLWHPVKPGGVPLWQPLRVEGGPVKSAVEWLKPRIWHSVIWLWFATTWRPLRQARPAKSHHGPAQLATGK